jgi:hypothetical protein
MQSGSGKSQNLRSGGIFESDQSCAPQLVRRSQPRLLITDEDVSRARCLASSDERAASWHRALKLGGESIIGEAPVRRILAGQSLPNMLVVSREASRRIFTLSGLFLLDNDCRWARRAIDEMLAAAAFEDWDPTHFLDVAEMTAALAVGLDWLGGTLSTDEIVVIRSAIIRLGLEPGLQAFERGEWWTKTDNNHAAVCAGGLTLGALAIGDSESAIAQRVIENSVDTISRYFAGMEPDGGWIEGPGYWCFGTKYATFMLSSLRISSSGDFGLSALEGVSETGWFRMHARGPTHIPFNYSDAREEVDRVAPQMFWMARAFDRVEYTDDEATTADVNPDILHLFWWSPSPGIPRSIGARLDLDAYFKRINVACFRSAWNDPDALYVAIKGGNNAASHAHLDLGSFVIDWAGHRWASDLGPDDYQLPGYFTWSRRWSYYRLKTESHNTVTLSHRNQKIESDAAIVEFTSSHEAAGVMIDLSKAYVPDAERVIRRLNLIERRRIEIVDEINLTGSSAIDWNMQTPAVVTIDGQALVLTLGGKSMLLTARASSPGRWIAERVFPGPPQADNSSYTRLRYRVEADAGNHRILVVFEPRQG